MKVLWLLGSSFIFAVGASAVPRPSPVDPPARVQLGVSVVEVPMRRVHGLPAVEVSINGSAPYRFVIDWGANILAVSPRLASEQKLPKAGVDEMGNENVRVEALAIGKARFEGLFAAVEPFLADKEEQGVLGVNVYAELLLTLDYPRGAVRVERGALPPADGQRVLPCAAGRGPDPAIQITVGERRLVAFLDTGASRAILLPEAMLRDLPLRAGPAAAGTATGPQVGALRLQEARLVETVQFGVFAAREPLVTFHPRPRALLGSGLLENFAITLDQRNARVRFARERVDILFPQAPWEKPKV